MAERIASTEAGGANAASLPVRAAFAWAALVAVLLAALACGGDSGSEPPSPTPFIQFKDETYPDELTNGYLLGRAGATWTLTVFEDFQCPYCLEFSSGNERLIIEEYVRSGKIRLEFRNFPVLGAESEVAASAAQCAADGDRFWELRRRLFVIQLEAGQLSNEQINAGRFTPEVMQRVAADSGLDAAAFRRCLDSEATKEKVREQVRVARELGVRGTPSFLLNGQPLAGITPIGMAAWRQLIDQALARR